MVKKGQTFTFDFYNHTAISGNIARIDKNLVQIDQGKPNILFEYQHLLAAYPYIPFVFFSLNITSRRFGHLLATCQGSLCTCRHFIGCPHFTRDARANGMPAFAHLLPVNVQIAEMVVDFVKITDGNIGISSKEALIFKENRLSLIYRYQVFVNACKISEDCDV